ncbi:aminotransferase class I/II-fold pyridoxal phosphate-dependent enzyme [Cutibacterium sp. WCA-380-WT-3A]|uniref:Aminotransferase n=1 Tax=Cutibacterium porci TaxID=2605781 RepID=A0A7K0J6N4_9ACTN|nr:aminotransferase class I/II-fold pyridoxal phosphate-dependent enzyme [Cutibacterium porci]MSS45621.1 aminotransferase class I/II-fold pyridoxal phosphate-dependent enzyme [Cutibacterium porci]
MKNPHLAKRYWKNVTTPMGSSDELVHSYDDSIDLSLGDPDVTTDFRIIDAAFRDARNGATHYTDHAGEVPLRQAIIDMYTEDYSHTRSLTECMITTSGCHAMWLVLEAILDDGDEVIVNEPYFTPYIQQIGLARGVPVVVAAREEDDWQIVPERIERAITERTKAIIINTPGNPTGVCYTRQTMEAIARIAVDHDLLVIADDIYTAYSYSAPFIPMMTLPNMAERTVTISSFSKDYAMTGWRIGYIVAPDYIIQTCKDINENNVFTAPSVSQRAAFHALRLRNEIQPSLVAEYRARSEHCYERVCETPHMSTSGPRGAIYLWVNISETGLSDVEVAARIFREAHVLTLPGTAFGPHCGNYLRLAVCVGIGQITEAFNRIQQMTIFSA